MLHFFNSHLFQVESGTRGSAPLKLVFKPFWEYPPYRHVGKLFQCLWHILKCLVGICYSYTVSTNKCLLEIVLGFCHHSAAQFKLPIKNFTTIKPCCSVDRTQQETEGTCNGFPGTCHLTACGVEADEWKSISKRWRVSWGRSRTWQSREFPIL